MTKLKYLILFILALPMVVAVAQNANSAQSSQSSSVDTTKVKRNYVHLLHADVTKFNKQINPDVWVLVGDVCFRHDSMYMYCDSAYFYNRKNALKAFGNVRMEQGDTLFLYGDYLDYDGDANLARVRNNVRLEDKTSTL